MARLKKKGSKLSFWGLGMKPEEDEKLEEFLRKEGYSARQLMKGLLRQWMIEVEKGGSGLLKYRIK
jgi:hypothetical protein